MYEAVGVERDSNVQFLTRQMHEYEVSGLQPGTGDGYAGMELLPGGAWHRNARTAGGIDHEAAAVETTRRGTTVHIWLAKHGPGAGDDQHRRIGRYRYGSIGGCDAGVRWRRRNRLGSVHHRTGRQGESQTGG